MFQVRKLKKFTAAVDENGIDLRIGSLFCQMNQLSPIGNKERFWTEAARWLKFVEEVEASGRWSKPHVATISSLGLIQLRRLLAEGVVLLDCQERTLENLVDKITATCIEEYCLEESLEKEIREALLLPHYHQYQRAFDKHLDHGEKKPISFLVSDQKKSKSKSDLKKPIDGAAEDHDHDDHQSISIDLDDHHDQFFGETRNTKFMKILPRNCKVANVLVGEIGSLSEEIVALVRLQHPFIVGNLSEVPLNSKYIFILLGPKGNLSKYSQVGKCMSTLFSDDLFQYDMFDAESKIDLVRAIDDFIEQSTILPPGQWDTSIRLTAPNKIPSREERLVLKMVKVKKDKPHTGGHDDDPSLQRTGRFCGGLIEDIKRKAPWYWSDFKDGFNFQCLPAIAFLFFACLSPIITFGGLLEHATDKQMGTIESLLSSLICGVLYSLFAGQPMTIIGPTGPVLVFEAIVNTFSKTYGIDFIGFRCWIGIWIFIMLLLIVVADISYLVKYITRFTEESFAMLITVIFVSESIDKLLKIRQTHRFTDNPFLYSNEFSLSDSNSTCFRCLHKNSSSDERVYFLNSSVVYRERDCENFGYEYEFLRDCKFIPDVFFFSMILYLGTFLLAMGLRSFKFSNFFPDSIRVKLSNFAVVTTIAIMVSIDFIVGIDTPKLHVPYEFHPTIPDRGWFINPLERNPNKWWLCFVAIPPAFLATILVFMDQHITAVIINRKTNKLKKSAGYHLDLLIIAICILINSLLGLPWLVAATVLSMNHMISLRKTSQSTVPGEPPKLIGAIEQRVTGVVIFVLIGCSIFYSKFLTLIPLAVLYAIVMYMGVTPLSELEFFQRILLIFMPKKQQPDLAFLRHVRLSRVHLFTFIQVFCLVVLFGLKLNNTISITFPLMVLGLVFIRFGLNYVFTQKELSYLDDLLPGRKRVLKRKLTIKDIDLNVLEKARKDQNDYIKRTSIRPEATATVRARKGSEIITTDEIRSNKDENTQNKEDSKPLI